MAYLVINLRAMELLFQETAVDKEYSANVFIGDHDYVKNAWI